MKIRKFFSSLYKCSLKVFALILALFFAFGVPALTRTAAAPAVSMRTVKQTEPIEHLFTHCLIAHPEIAFAKNNEYGRHLDRDCLTPSEFRRILQFLYEGGYALADIRDTFREKGVYAERIPFDFPADKKPLLLSFDDVDCF
ncbi:MAG: hypothetical protein ACLS4Z_10375 [Christensenellaceae bacterium]